MHQNWLWSKLNMLTLNFWNNHSKVSVLGIHGCFFMASETMWLRCNSNIYQIFFSSVCTYLSLYVYFDPVWTGENSNQFQICVQHTSSISCWMMYAVQSFHPGKKNSSKKRLKAQNYYDIHACYCMLTSDHSCSLKFKMYPFPSPCNLLYVFVVEQEMMNRWFFTMWRGG